MFPLIILLFRIPPAGIRPVCVLYIWGSADNKWNRLDFSTTLWKCLLVCVWLSNFPSSHLSVMFPYIQSPNWPCAHDQFCLFFFSLSCFSSPASISLSLSLYVSGESVFYEVRTLLLWLNCLAKITSNCWFCGFSAVSCFTQKTHTLT